ncbi:MAG: TraB/GumN family protein [Lysobacter sp.]|nr:MAG: TraB/GumN family protein [Lysobacter sp.]
MRPHHPAMLAFVLWLAPAQAQVTSGMPIPASEHVLDTAVVRMPGPGMWKIRNGDNVLWVLGTVSPLPAGMAWNASKVRAIVREADAMISAPSVVVGADIGFFGKLALLPSLIGVRANPDGRKLSEVVPAPLYARWSVLKQRHMGRDDSVENWRPIFAAGKLYDEATRRIGLSGRDVVYAEINEAMKARGLKPVNVSARIKIANPKAVVKEFKGARFADIECFEKTLDRVEMDLPVLAARANAWATGDVQALTTLRHPDLGDVCERAMLGGQFAAKYGMDALEAQSRRKWIAEAGASLARHRVTLAILPMNDVLAPDGLVAELANKGYVVEAPR